MTEDQVCLRISKTIRKINRAMRKTDREIYELGTLTAYDIQVKNGRASSSVISAMIEYHEEKRNEHAESALILEKLLDEYKSRESRATTQKSLSDSTRDTLVRKLLSEQLKPLFSPVELAGYRQNYLKAFDTDYKDPQEVISELVEVAENRSQGNIVEGMFDLLVVGNWLCDQRGDL